MPKNVIKEKEDFQRYILDYLKNKNGYVVRDAKTCFNSHYAMDIELLFQFLNDTQADTMEKLEKIYAAVDLFHLLFLIQIFERLSTYSVRLSSVDDDICEI